MPVIRFRMWDSPPMRNSSGSTYPGPMTKRPSRTSRARNASNGRYHSRSQWVCETTTRVRPGLVIDCRYGHTKSFRQLLQPHRVRAQAEIDPMALTCVAVYKDCIGVQPPNEQWNPRAVPSSNRCYYGAF